MGIKNRLLADDIDILADELLKREDPDPQELMSTLLMRGLPQSENDLGVNQEFY